MDTMSNNLIKFPDDKSVEKHMAKTRYKFNLSDVVSKIPITTKSDKPIFLYKTSKPIYYVINLEGRIIGRTGLHIVNSSASLDTEIHLDFRNMGIGTLAVNAIVKDIFESAEDKDRQINLLIIETIHPNAIKVATKCGFTSSRDFLYTITREEYFRQKSQRNEMERGA